MTDALKLRAVADLGGGPAVDAVRDDAPKACWSGTHRALTPAETLRWIEPLFQGVSLLAAVSLASRNQVVKVPRRKRTSIGGPSGSLGDLSPIDAKQ